MIDITKIDENFAVKTKLEKDDELCYYDTEAIPFKIYGVKKENGKFRRLPEAIAVKSKYYLDDDKKRLEIIRTTYENAIAPILGKFLSNTGGGEVNQKCISGTPEDYQWK